MQFLAHGEVEGGKGGKAARFRGAGRGDLEGFPLEGKEIA